MFNLVAWSLDKPRALHAQRHKCAVRISQVLYLFLLAISFFAIAFKVSSKSLGILRLATEMSLEPADSGMGFWKGVLMVGNGSYSMWWKVGLGGALPRRVVRSMNGGVLTVRPRAISDHVFMKWRHSVPSARVSVPSARVWCHPTPRHTPPHANLVTYQGWKSSKWATFLLIS